MKVTIFIVAAIVETLSVALEITFYNSQCNLVARATASGDHATFCTALIL